MTGRTRCFDKGALRNARDGKGSTIVASRTLSFPPRRTPGTRAGAPRRSGAQSTSRRLEPCSSQEAESSWDHGARNRLHLVGSLAEQVRYRPAPPAAVQARVVAAQVEWEIARQAGRDTRSSGTLLLLPVEVARPSARKRALSVLRRLLGGQGSMLNG